MKKKRINWLFSVILSGLLFACISCQNEDDNNDDNNPPTILPNCGTVTDIDGNVYNTVTIGSQCWMVENLNVSRYRNGDAIPNVTNNPQWSSYTQGAYCNYNNTDSISTIYGRLYNWYAVNDSRGLAPLGWHVGTDAEWSTLINFLGGGSIAGGKLKEVGTTHWVTPNTGATNETGFTARPAGHRHPSGIFDGIGSYGNSWCSNESSPSNAWTTTMNSISPEIIKYEVGKNLGFSVRCIKD